MWYADTGSILQIAESAASHPEAIMSESAYQPPVKVFYSYSHKDEVLRNELEKHLTLLQRQGVIAGWYDRRISVGTEWSGEIDGHLRTAEVILLLVSTDFMASDYCYDIEMKLAMTRHEARGARVIPIILRPVDWKGAPFGKLQALPTDGKPVTIWTNQDEAFLDVTEGIRAAIGDMRAKAVIKSRPGASMGPTVGALPAVWNVPHRRNPNSPGVGLCWIACGRR